MKTWRFIDTGANDCYSNMAIDEALFQAYEPEHSLPIFRIYTWKPAAFSIGLSQNPELELDLTECGNSGIGFVRRMTGGGVIFHDKELTYSIVCSEKDTEKICFAKETYKFLCAFLINVYRSMGLDAEFSLKSDKAPKTGWVCFGRKEKYDIVIGGKKIGGNAQRRRRDLIFQHGSIPLDLDLGDYSRFLRRSHVLIQKDVCSLSQAMGRPVNCADIRGDVLEAFRKCFKTELFHDKLSPTEQGLQDHFIRTKYGTREWNIFGYADKAKASVA
jgi:lipoyl(octanoyl) transferase